MRRVTIDGEGNGHHEGAWCYGDGDTGLIDGDGWSGTEENTSYGPRLTYGDGDYTTVNGTVFTTD